MENSRLVHILRTFNKKELREFKKWLQSPVHNQREDITTLFEYLAHSTHLQKEKYLQKEKVFPKVFPNQTYDDAKMRQVMFFLLKQVEQFLIYNELIEEESRSKTALASVYRKRNLNKSCEKTLRTIEQLQKNQPYRNEQFLRNNYLLQREKYSYLSGFQRTNLNLQDMSDALDATFIADKLRQSCLMLSHQTVYKTNYEIGLLNEILKYVENTDSLKTPAISIYYYVYQTLKAPENEAHFFSLKDEMYKYGDVFPEFEIRNIYLMAINYCIKKINTGNKEFTRQAFDLYKEGVTKKILMENNTISKMTFLNTVINGTLLKEFTWVEQFINNYQEYLEQHHRQNIVTYSFASLFYEKKDYDQSMGYLIKYEIDDILLNLNSKSMLLKMYYEKDELTAFESLLGSFSTYLQRKKIMGYHKAGYSNLIKLARKLNRVNPYDKAEVLKLKDKIVETQPLTSSNRRWLLEQIEKL